MGLDNGAIVRSNHRKITREMLPEGMVYPWDEKFDSSDGGVEILYWRKNWGLRDIVVETFPLCDNAFRKDARGNLCFPWYRARYP